MDLNGPLSAVCPFCEQEPLALVTPTQALCGTEGCPCFMWNPLASPAENRAGATPMTIATEPLREN